MYMRVTRLLWLACLLGLALLSASSCRVKPYKDTQPKAEETQQQDPLQQFVLKASECSRIYTTECHVRKIITFSDDMRLKGKLPLTGEFNLKLPLGERKIIIPLDAEIKAFIDFSGFSKKNVEQVGDSITITLPDPGIMITSTEIDYAAMREYTGLMRSSFSDAELTALAKQGRDTIVSHLPEYGIIEAARTSAENLLFPILNQAGLGKAKFTIRFKQKYSATDLQAIIRKTDSNGK